MLAADSRDDQMGTNGPKHESLGSEAFPIKRHPERFQMATRPNQDRA